ncbi:MAG: MBL fold metallo-hydrolase [Archangium sp.]|nr:MBL fold metallo-hydrolase [Archangium sp.]
MRRARRIAISFFFFMVGLASSGAAVGCALSGARWSGPTTDHFNGDRFSTPNGKKKLGGFDLDGFSALIRWQTSRVPGVWRPYHDEPPGPRPPNAVPTGGLRVTFINHATALIQLDGVNVLTDPIFSERASPFEFAGPKRVRPPGIRFDDLPRIDAVVISHNHYDHLDLATLRRLTKTWPKVQIFVGLGNKAFLASRGLDNVTELDWWEERPLGAITIGSAPVQHFSNRGLTDEDGTLWSGWVITGAGGRTFFGGDTGYGPHFKAIGDRLGPFRLAVLPIGAYKPEWFMSPVHMSPSDAVDAALDLRAGMSVPVHFGTFQMADDGETEPIDALQLALKEKPAPFTVLGFGEGLDVAPLPEAAP